MSGQPPVRESQVGQTFAVRGETQGTLTVSAEHGDLVEAVFVGARGRYCVTLGADGVTSCTCSAPIGCSHGRTLRAVRADGRGEWRGRGPGLSSVGGVR